MWPVKVSFAPRFTWSVSRDVSTSRWLSDLGVCRNETDEHSDSLDWGDIRLVDDNGSRLKSTQTSQALPKTPVKLCLTCSATDVNLRPCNRGHLRLKTTSDTDAKSKFATAKKEFQETLSMEEDKQYLKSSNAQRSIGN